MFYDEIKYLRGIFVCFHIVSLEEYDVVKLFFLLFVGNVCYVIEN